MTEEKRVLPQETLEQVTGGNEEKTCPKDKHYPTQSCRNLSCPYRSESHCTLYNEDIPSGVYINFVGDDSALI